jgi:hypothetical protein
MVLLRYPRNEITNSHQEQSTTHVTLLAPIPQKGLEHFCTGFLQWRACISPPSAQACPWSICYAFNARLAHLWSRLEPLAISVGLYHLSTGVERAAGITGSQSDLSTLSQRRLSLEPGKLACPRAPVLPLPEAW